MNKIKILKTALVLLGLVGFFSFQGTGLAGTARPSDKIQIVTSLPLVKNIVATIGGDKVTVESIVQGPKCDHEYEPSPSDLKKLALCSVFIKIGMGSDPWADKLAGILNKRSLFIDPAKDVKIMKVCGLENPHYWGSPDNVKIMAKNIMVGLTSIAPSQKAYFENNYQRLREKIDKTALALKAKVSALKNKKLVSYSGAFPYFYQYFGFENLRTVEVSCEQEVSPRDIADAIKLIKERKIKILVGDAAEPNEPDGLAQETKAAKILLWATTDNSNDYLTTLRHNVELLVSALK